MYGDGGGEDVEELKRNLVQKDIELATKDEEMVRKLAQKDEEVARKDEEIAALKAQLQ
eukprot:COSAG05_NODE_1564_length_4546_cov_8.210929_4_plen_58_part_00